MTINGVKFIEDAQGPQTPGATGDEGYRGFNVTLTKELIDPANGGPGQLSSGGVYKVEYRVEFTGGHLRGNVPALVVSSKVPTTVAATGGYQANDGTGATTGAYPLGAGIVGTLATCCDASCSSTTCPEDVGALYLDKQLAFTVREGAQPDGSIKLSYECEARTQNCLLYTSPSPRDS